ncbi:5-oxoprolinase subunit PxpB [Bacillus tianshenii]|nr:5-oxoprolinase subunit PxpB [Bacillus tianshenii]
MEQHIQPLGDTGIQLSFGTEISKETNKQIRRFHEYLKQDAIPGIIESVPAYTSLSIFYDPFTISYDELVSVLKDRQHRLDEIELPSALIYEIPVLYGSEVGPDLADVAAHNGLTEEDVIALHSSNDYLIYMMGFVPGFPYLGGMTTKIATPRLENPRAKVEAGSVGIAGEQTGIYPLESPGGWRLIGKTPITLYDPERTPPALFSTGNYLRFTPITADEYDEISQQVEDGTYKIQTYEAREEIDNCF